MEKNRFKFIQKTKQISNYRGDRVDDGLIRVEFAFEKEKPEIVHHYHVYHNKDDWYWPYGPRYYKNNYLGRAWPNSSVKCNFNSSNNITAVMESNTSYGNNSFNDNGITVKGSEINQNFDYGNIDELELSHVMIIKLRGKKRNKTTKIKKPITVKTKLVCPTCGKKSNSNSKFCSNCGTFIW